MAAPNTMSVVPIATRTIQLRSKRYYVDGLEDSKRKGTPDGPLFIKLTESYQDGRRNRINFPLQLGWGLRDALVKCQDFAEKYVGEKGGNKATKGAAPAYGTKKVEVDPETGIFFTKTIVEGNRRYFCDMIETARGYPLLRLTQVIGTQSGNHRYSIGISGDGISKISEALVSVLKELGTEDPKDAPVPEPRHLRLGSRVFHFDVGKSYRGLYMKISEVNSAFRDSINVPQSLWSKFRDIMDDYLDAAGMDEHDDADDEDEVGKPEDEDDAMPSARGSGRSSGTGEKKSTGAGGATPDVAPTIQE